MSSEEDGPLSRWARRKAEVRKGRGGATPAVEKDPAPAPPAETLASESVAESAPATEPAPPELPDIDSLTAESDFTAFLKEGVPRNLRRLALRKLWTSDPVLANLDGLVDYGEDYTDAAMVVEGMKSAWQVGRGYAREEPAGEPESEGTESGTGDAEVAVEDREAARSEAEEPAAGAEAAVDDDEDEDEDEDEDGTGAG